MCTQWVIFATCINLLFKIFTLIFSIFDTIAGFFCRGYLLSDVYSCVALHVIAVEVAWWGASRVAPCLKPAASVLQVLIVDVYSAGNVSYLYKHAIQSINIYTNI